MGLVCKWEIKGTNPTVGERSTAELDDIAKRVDNQLDDMFGSGSSSYREADDILREAETKIRYEQELAKKRGIPYVERQIAAAGTGQMSALALKIVRTANILKKGKVPVEGDYGIYEYSQKDIDKLTSRTLTKPEYRVSSGTPSTRVPSTPRVAIPRITDIRIPTPTYPETRIPPPNDRRPPPPSTERRLPPPSGGKKFPLSPRPPTSKVPPTALIPIPSLKGGKKKRRFPMDSFAWKQGFGWWVSMPPYSGTIGKDMIFTRTKPAGVPIGRTPAETITKLGINVPKGNLLDLGIMDISIKKKGSKIKYTRDVKQKTKLGRPVGVPPGIQFARGR